MEQINTAQAQRVWQRVRGSEAPGQASDLSGLLALVAEVRHTYQYLQKNTALRDSRLLARLREESQRMFSTLAGLALVWEQDLTLTAPPAIRGNAEGLLLRCYHTQLRAIGLLDSLPGERTDWAPLLRRRMEEHTMTILELLGQLPRK